MDYLYNAFSSLYYSEFSFTEMIRNVIYGTFDYFILLKIYTRDLRTKLIKQDEEPHIQVTSAHYINKNHEIGKHFRDQMCNLVFDESNEDNFLLIWGFMMEDLDKTNFSRDDVLEIRYKYQNKHYRCQYKVRQLYLSQQQNDTIEEQFARELVNDAINNVLGTGKPKFPPYSRDEIDEYNKSHAFKNGILSAEDDEMINCTKLVAEYAGPLNDFYEKTNITNTYPRYFLFEDGCTKEKFSIQITDKMANEYTVTEESESITLKNFFS